MPQGGATKRPGTKYIAEVKTSSLSTRIFPFEYSTEQSYIIEAGNQYIRFFTDGAAVLTGGGTETDATYAAAGTVISHWKMNDAAANMAVDDTAVAHDGVASGNTEDIDADGKVGTGCFDLEGTYAIAITDGDDADFTFVEGTDGDFSIAGWIRVTETGLDQTVMAKWDETTGSWAREWKLVLDSDLKLKMSIADESLLLDSELISQWKLNDSANSTTITDETGTNTGAMDDEGDNYTSTHSVDGKTGNAIDFDGTNDKIEIEDSASLSFGDGSDDSPFSISAWINMDDATDFSILTKRGVSGQFAEWAFFLDAAGKLVIRLYDHGESPYIGKTYDTALVFVEGVWLHVAMTYDATEASSGIKIYLNGAERVCADDEDGVYTSMHDEPQEIWIGYMERTAAYSDGKIDNVMVFDRELTPAEITALYNATDGVEILNTQYISTITDDALNTGWKYVAMTYEGEEASWTGASAADDIILYVDGSAVDVTATNLSTYVGMEDTAAQARIGAQESTAGVIDKIFGSKIDNLAIFSDTMSVADVLSLYDATEIYEISTPYLTADLFEMKYEQSADVLYITHPDYETEKLARSSNDDWTLTAIGIENGPFRTQNNVVTKTITASATTGSITLTASGFSPFVAGTTYGHLPSGSATTSKSQTGALFKLVHPLEELEYSGQLTADFTAGQVEDTSWIDGGVLYKDAEWTFVTGETWYGTVKVQRNYTIGAAVGNGADEGASLGWETVFSYNSGSGASTDARNVSTTGTENDGDAQYRVIYSDEVGDDTVGVYFSTDQTEVIGIVEITAVASSTSATGTVIETLGSTDATYKWSEGSWSNYRGWPQTVTFFEDRLCFGGNTSQPDTIWASVTSDYENMEAGVNDDSALAFTLSSRQVNVIEWIVGKDKLLIGTSGAEWTIAGGTDEPLTPSNVLAKQNSTYGSANIQATMANESVLFFQRGKEKMRELAYNWEIDSYVAPDMTILSNFVTDSGIDDTAFQKTPDSVLWCIRNDGELPIFSYERGENITAWSRLVTQTNQAGTLTDSDFESVASIHGDPEDEVWVIVERIVDSNTVRYIEQFQPRDFGDDDEDAFYVDSGITYDSTASSAMTGLDHLEGETVYVLADGVIFDTAVVSGGAITLKSSGTTTTASTVQIGLGYEAHLRTMPLSCVGGATIHGKQKKISEVIAEWDTSGDFSIGRDVGHLQTYIIDGQTTSIDRQTFPPGYDRNGYIYIYQQSPEPLTLLSIMAEFNIN